MSSDTDAECWQTTCICSVYRVTLTAHPDAGFVLCRCYTICTEAFAPSVHSDEVLNVCLKRELQGSSSAWEHEID